MTTITMIIGLMILPATPQDDKTLDRKAREAVKTFKKEYRKAGSPSVRKEALQALGEVPHELTVKALVNHLTSDSNAVRTTAAETLKKMKEVEKAASLIAPALLHKANAEKTTVRLAIIGTLVDLGQPEAVPYLHKLIEDKDFIIASTAIKVLPQLARKESVPVLIDFLKKCEREPGWGARHRLEKKKLIIKNGEDKVQWNFTVKLDADEEQAIRHLFLLQSVHTSLTSLTEESFASHKKWNAWWKQYGSRFKIEIR